MAHPSAIRPKLPERRPSGRHPGPAGYGNGAAAHSFADAEDTYAGSGTFAAPR